MKQLVGIALFVSVVVACSNLQVEDASCVDTGCGVHGRCAIEAESPSCICEPGYAGRTCTQCASGFQDVFGNGFCSSLCEATRCGPHEQCSEESGRGVCSCVVGYSAEGYGCTFTGGPLDPSFEAEASPWTTSGAVTITPGRPNGWRAGGTNGWARFGAGGGELTQTFEMPAYDDAEPLALEVDFTCGPGGSCGNVFGPPALRFGRRETRWQAVFGAMTQQMCLGEAAYGRTVTLGIRTYAHPPGSSQLSKPSQDLFVGRAQVVPSSTCAAPGTVKDGDFETGLWHKDGDAAFSYFEGSSVRARLTSSCDSSAQIATSISIPEALPSPALAFSIEGSPGVETFVMLDKLFTVGSVVGTGKNERAVLCLPEHTRGLAFELEVIALRNCAGTSNVVYVDDFAIVSDPNCVPLPPEERETTPVRPPVARETAF